MNLQQTLPPDDLPPVELTQADELLQQSLLAALSKHFYEGCSGVVQAVLLNCDWQVWLRSTMLGLDIRCEDAELGGRVRNYLDSIVRSLSQLSHRIRICVDAPGQAQPYEVQYDSSEL